MSEESLTPDTSTHDLNYRPKSEPTEEFIPAHRRYADQRDILPNIMPEHIERIVITPRLIQVAGADGQKLKPVTVLYREIILTEDGHKFLQAGYADLKAGKQAEYSVQGK